MLNRKKVENKNVKLGKRLKNDSSYFNIHRSEAISTLLKNVDVAYFLQFFLETEIIKI